MQADLEVLDM